jgi:hypothetical protein
VANSTKAAWLWGPVFWQTFICDPNREDPLKMTSQAFAANPDEAAVEAAVPLPTTDDAAPPADNADPPAAPVEIGGRAGPEPTRYGDWEMRGRCIDF